MLRTPPSNKWISGEYPIWFALYFHRVRRFANFNLLNLEDALATLLTTIPGGRSRESCKTGVLRWATLCNCGRGSPVPRSLSAVQTSGTTNRPLTRRLSVVWVPIGPASLYKRARVSPRVSRVIRSRPLSKLSYPRCHIKGWRCLTGARLASSGRSGCTFVDYDRDGKLDLFVAHYLEFDFESVPKPGDRLYLRSQQRLPFSLQTVEPLTHLRRH